MATALVNIANNTAGKISGFGDQLNGAAFITAALLAANADKVSIWFNDKYPVIRKKVIEDFATMGTPFKETQKFADLGVDLKQYDIAISSISVSSTVVTITTTEVHGRSTGDTVYLADIKQDNDIEGTLLTSLNGTTVTVTVVDTTSFTIDTAGVDATWVHEAGTGIVSYVPEIGAWSYAFNLPSDLLAMVRYTDEDFTVADGVQQQYQYKTILNKDGDGHILLANDKTNCSGDGAFIEYCIDQTTFAMFSSAFEECITTLLAAELCPLLGKNLKVRQEILVEYKTLTVPDAKAFNQSQFNNYSKITTNYRGGRT